MHKELKKEIMNWLFENENKWQRINSCTKEFSEYIFKKDGSYLIGGKEVSKFITDADKVLYG